MSVPKEAELTTKAQMILMLLIGLAIGLAVSYWTGLFHGYSQGVKDTEEFFNRGHPAGYLQR